MYITKLNNTQRSLSVCSGIKVYVLGPVHMEVGDPGKVRLPALVGFNQSLHTISLYFLITFTCEVGYRPKAGCPVSRGR